MVRYDKLVLATRGNSPDRGKIQLFIDWNRNLIELDYTILIPFRKQFLLSYLSYAIQKKDRLTCYCSYFIHVKLLVNLTKMRHNQIKYHFNTISEI